jgi:tRNA threonylcarbamoyladenosine biosynthesis protein TsaB
MICGVFSDKTGIPDPRTMNIKPDIQVYLILNCAEAVLQVVLGTPQGLLWSQELNTPGRAMKHIAPAIKAGLDFTGISSQQLSGISCVEGPGSFTGIRMAYAHVHGMSLPAKIPMSSISYFAALIHGPGKLLQGPAWIFIHSRRGQVYAMNYSLPSLKPLSKPANINLWDIPDLAGSAKTRSAHAFGSGVRKNPDYFPAEHWNILPETWDTPLPQSLLEISLDSAFSAKVSFPEYLRPSDAEENQGHILPRLQA